jgi:hypothetical protein
MNRDLKDKIRNQAAPSGFADRLLAIASQIERDFDGRERARLLKLVHETLERHVEIRENTRLARESLEQLAVAQRELLQLFDFISASPERQTMH